MTTEDGARIGAAALFQLEASFVARIIARLGVPDRDLDDAVQEVFLTVHRRGGFTPDKAKVRTWLAEIAVRVAANVRRTRRRKPTTSAEELETVATHQLDPHEATVQRERLERVAQVLEALPVAQRQVFVQFEIEGEPCETIAQGLGVPVGTVYSRLHGARRAFHTVFEAGGKRLLAALAVGSTVALARSASAAGLRGSWTTLFLSKLVFGMMTAAVLVSSDGGHISRGPSHARAASAPLLSERVIASAPPVDVQPTPAPRAEKPATIASSPRPSASTAPASRPPRAQQSRSIAEDLREVTTLKGLVKDNPAEALRRIQSRPSEQNGVLTEEREILAIEALAAVGNGAQARRNAAAFIGQHPQSPYLARARQVIEWVSMKDR